MGDQYLKHNLHVQSKKIHIISHESVLCSGNVLNNIFWWNIHVENLYWRIASKTTVGENQNKPTEGWKFLEIRLKAV